MEEILVWITGDKVVPALEWCLETMEPNSVQISSGLDLYNTIKNPPEEYKYFGGYCNYKDLLSIDQNETYHNIIMRGLRKSYYRCAFKISFQNTNDALMFKLKWC